MTIQVFDLARQKAAISARLEAAMARVMDHMQFVGGPEVGALETALAARLGGGHAVACANGTDALQIMLRAAGIGAGDAVAVPSLTFAATAEAVKLVGGVPVFVDTDPGRATLCPESLDRAIAAGLRGDMPRLRAVLPVDLFSIPADHPAIAERAEAHGLVHLVDAAHSYGTETPWGPCGTQGLAAATSFYPSKALGGYGDAGAVFTADEGMARRMKGIAHHGVLPGGSEHALLGTNSRLDSLQAAVLLCKLEIFDAEIAARRRIAARYLDALGDHCTLPEVPADCAPVWSYFCIRHPERDALSAHLAERGIRSVAYYRQPTHLHPAFAGDPVAPGGLAGTMAYAETLLCLPVHPYLDAAEVEAVIDAVRGFRR